MNLTKIMGLLGLGLSMTSWAAQAPQATVSADQAGYTVKLQGWPAERQAALAPDMTTLFSDSVNYGGSRRGFIEGDILYVADWFSGLHLYDISDPLKPKHLSAYHTQGSPKGVWLQDGHAFVGDDDHGVQIIDVHDPRKPTLLSTLDTPGLAYSLRVQDKTLYLADHRGGFHIIDISDLQKPRIIGSLDTPGKVWGLALRGQTVFLADDRAGLICVDVSDPTQPRQIGAFSPGGAAEEVMLDGDVAYVAFYDQGLMVLDVQDPRQPRLLGQLQTAGNARGLERQGDLLLLADWQAGVEVIDIKDPQKPRLLGGYDTPGAAWGVKLRDQYAYVLDWWGGLQVLDLKDPAKPALAASYHAQGQSLDVLLQERFAYVATGASVQIFDAQTPLNPIWISSVDVEAERLLLDGDSLYVAGGGKLLRIDVRNPFQPGAAEPVPLMAPGQIERIASSQGWLYVLQRQKLYRMRPDGKEPQLIADPRILASFWPRGAQALDFAVSGDNLLLLSNKGVEIFQAGADQKLRPVGQDAVKGSRLQWLADHILLFGVEPSLVIYQLQDHHLNERTRIPLPAPLLDVQTDGPRLFALDTQGALWQFDLSVPQSPRLQAQYSGLSGQRRFSAHGQRVLLAGQSVPASLKLLPPIQQQDGKAGKLTIKLDKGAPAGAYDLLAHDPQSGHTERFSAAFTLKPAAGKKFTQEDLQREMKARGIKP